MMKTMDCQQGKMMKRRKGTENCPAPVLTKRPVNKPPSGLTPRPNTQPGAKLPSAKPSRKPSADPTFRPSGNPSHQPSSHPSSKPTDFGLDDTVLFVGSNGNGHR